MYDEHLDNVSWLEKFYNNLCDGDWEHDGGFDIGTLDNPGWRFKFDLSETKWRDLVFEPIKEERSENNWIYCHVDQRNFVGAGGPFNLNEIISAFRFQICKYDHDMCVAEESKKKTAL